MTIDGGARRVALAACAKVNLALDLLGPRPDGYTEIATVFQSVDLADDVEVELDPAGSGIELHVEPAAPCADDENLAVRAAKLYVERFGGLGRISIRLVKRIPAGAGLGGGSSDAAATLRALDELAGGRAAPGELARLGRGLGADVPFFLVGGTAIGIGRGDEIEPLEDLRSWPIVLARTGRPLATAEVYRLARIGLTVRRDAPNISRFRRHLREAPSAPPPLSNGLEPAAFRLEPLIPRLIASLAECGGRAGMTGSGSTVFALFEREEDAREAAARTAAAAPQGSFVHCARTIGRAAATRRG